MLIRIVNGILLNHNIEKQASDSQGDVAYLMADISDVKEGEIRDLFQSLQELSCKCRAFSTRRPEILTWNSMYPNESVILGDVCM